jgi:vacuolar-type H+-ATPase subunit I/STV1
VEDFYIERYTNKSRKIPCSRLLQKLPANNSEVSEASTSSIELISSRHPRDYTHHLIHKAEMSNLDKLIELESRMTSLEANQNSTTANQSADEILVLYQSQVASKLKLIREKLLAEGADIDKVREERDAMASENKLLKKEIERLNYRVNHLVKSLSEEESKNK